MKTTGWLALTVLGLAMIFAGEVNAASRPKVKKKKYDYTVKPYKFKKFKRPKAPKVVIRPR
ncbi:MAG: hypothetical protein ABL967_04915 [Bryobacteraceae bacterium]